MHIRTLSEKTEILSILTADRLYAAYPIGDLTNSLFEQCEWAVAESDKPCALAMKFNGLATPALFVMGDSEGIRAILQRKLRPPQVYLTLRPEHMPVIDAIYRTHEQRLMWRMSVDRQSFQPPSLPAKRLHASDLAELNALYMWGGADFFAAYQFEQGIYYAVMDDGKLVAAAGTHVVALEYGIAAVGNVYTHRDYRNRSYATTCTGAVTAELLEKGCQTVVLNVRQDNTPAVRAYQKLGFSVHCPYVEARGQRRSGIEQIIYRVIGRIPTRPQNTDKVL